MPVAELLSKDYAAKRRALINPNKALDSSPPVEINLGHDTTYFTVVDRDGNAVSFIKQSFRRFWIRDCRRYGDQVSPNEAAEQSEQNIRPTRSEAERGETMRTNI